MHGRHTTSSQYGGRSIERPVNVQFDQAYLARALETPAAVDPQGRTMVHRLLMANETGENRAWIQRFMAAGTDPNAVDAAGEDLLMTALRYHHGSAVCGILTGAGAAVRREHYGVANEKRRWETLDNVPRYACDQRRVYRHPAHHLINIIHRARPAFHLVDGPTVLPPEVLLCVFTVAFRTREINAW